MHISIDYLRYGYYSKYRGRYHYEKSGLKGDTITTEQDLALIEQLESISDSTTKPTSMAMKLLHHPQHTTC